MRIIYRNCGIASVHTDKNKKWIEINKNLLKYPKLYKQVLAHEFKHLKSNKAIDFKIDMFDKSPKGMWRFILKHPKSLTELLPVWTNYKKQLTPNYYLCVMYGITSSILLAYHFLLNII